MTPDDLSFYLVRMEAYQIDDSKPAPHFEIEAGPSPTVKERGQRKESLVNIQSVRNEFYEGLYDREEKRDEFYAIDLEPARKAGLRFYYWIYPEKWAVKFYMEGGEKARNKEVFDHLYADKQEVEKEFGSELEWYRLDNNKSSRIEYVFEGEGLSVGESRWPSIQDAMIDKFYGLVDAIYPRIEPFAEPVVHSS